MLKDGYHIVSLPTSSLDKLLINTELTDAWQAHCIAKVMSYYSHKVTAVVYCEADIDTRDLVWVFLDGEEVKWF